MLKRYLLRPHLKLPLLALFISSKTPHPTMPTRASIVAILNLGMLNALRAIVFVIAHWSERVPTISNGATHSLYYDYGGFLREAYALKYLALRSPDVVDEVFAALKEAGFKPQMDRERGWDDEVFVPMMLIHPKADIPIHYEMGKVLGRLRDSGVAIVGSGIPTMYNLRAIFSGKMSEEGYRRSNVEWSDVLTKMVLRQWVGSKEAHFVKGEEHFLLLVVCAGAGGEGEGGAFGNDTIGTK
ncbi:extradiol ring-cleavage dioxygenase class iii protein-like protein subunit B [Cadophora sp. MPI-SDFR-AT-0126]|nr:extradiol ring-cleavage dioxygenase class iii protein-like protein subunit B [Leotiomycetes sp. MPI-SDFR-AT-0126]